MKRFYLLIPALAFALNSCGLFTGNSNFHTECFSSKQADGELNTEMGYTKITKQWKGKYAINIGNGLVKIYDAEYERKVSEDSVIFRQEKDGVYYFESKDPDLLTANALSAHHTYIFNTKEKTLSCVYKPLFGGTDNPMLHENIYYID